VKSSYAELKKDLLADGVLDATEVKNLRALLYADGVIDREEAELLFDLNDATSGAKNDPGWRALFVDAITSYLLEDKNSPNEIDDSEATWLITHIEEDGELDDNEKALLKNIEAKAKKVSAKLQGKFQ